VVPPARDQVPRLDEAGGGQDEVGEAGGVGQEQVVDDREQILAREALEHQALVGRDHGRVAVVDDEHADGRPELRIGQCPPEPDHVDHAGLAGG
jgi:hypothetical protein